MERIIGEDIKKNTSMSNRIISFIGKVFVVIWVGSSALWSRPFFVDYYQEQANRHYDGLAQWFQIGPVFIVALIFSIHSFLHKKFFLGVLTAIIAIWSFYWAFMVSFSCYDCTYGG